MRDSVRRAAVALAVVLALAGPPAIAGHLAGSYFASQNVVYGVQSGPAVTLDSGKQVAPGNPMNTSAGDIRLVTGSGNVTFASAGDTEARLDRVNGTWTNVSALNVTYYGLEVDPGDKPAAGAEGPADALRFKDPKLNDREDDLNYTAGSSGTNLTLNGLPANTLVVAYDEDTGHKLAQNTTDASGSVVYTRLAGGSRDVALSDTVAPALDAQSASPASGTDTNNEDVELSVPVSDGDFGQEGDNVTVDFYVDGAVVSSQTVSSNTTVTYTATGLSDGAHDWLAEATDDYGNTDSFSTKSFEVFHYDPVFDNSSASPTGDLQTNSPDLTIDVNDTDFAEPSGDTVTVEFYHNGAKVGEDTLVANGTAVYQNADPVGGENEWYAVATDEYGQSSTSKTFTYNAPSQLGIYNETNSSQLVKNVTVDVGFYFDRDNEQDLVVQRNTTDGTLNMTGLPTNEPFVVVAESDGYFNRRIWVPSLYDTQKVYLLNESVDAVQPTFTLVDYTGDFPRDRSVVRIQRSINGTWQTVEGDYFGAANQMSAQLAYNQRHRILVTNPATNETRDLGVFTPTASATIPLEISEDSEVIANRFLPAVDVGPQVGALPARSNVTLNVTVDPQDATVRNYTVSVVDSTGSELFSRSYAQDGGTHDVTVDLSGPTDRSVTVWVNWTTEDGLSEQVDRGYSLREYAESAYALLPALLAVDMGGAPNAFSALLVAVLTVVTTGYAATKMNGGPAGLVGLCVVTAGALIGWIPMTWLVASGLGWAVFAGLQSRL